MTHDDLFMHVSEDDVCGAGLDDPGQRLAVSSWLTDCRHGGSDWKISEEER